MELIHEESESYRKDEEAESNNQDKKKKKKRKAMISMLCKEEIPERSKCMDLCEEKEMCFDAEDDCGGSLGD